MNEKLDIVRRLYEETGDPEALARLLDDEALRAEYEALREVKQRLDARPRRRPDAAVLARVYEVAGVPAPPVAEQAGPRVDRAPVPGRAAWRTRIYGMAGSLVVLLALGIGVWHLAPFREAPFLQDHAATLAEPALAEEKAEQEAIAKAAPRAVVPPARSRSGPEEARALPEAPAPAGRAQQEAWRSFVATGEADAVGATGLSAEAAVLPAWDEADDVRRLHRRIEQLDTREAGLAWDEVALPIEVVPAASGRTGTPGLHQAGQRRVPRRGQ